MEESLRTLILKEFPHDEIDIRTYSPGTLAFLGDAVYSLVIRTILWCPRETVKRRNFITRLPIMSAPSSRRPLDWLFTTS